MRAASGSPGQQLALRLFKVFVIFGFPLLGGIYFYQFTGDLKEVAVPFETSRIPDKAFVQPPQGGAPMAIPLRTPITVINFWATWCPPCVEEFPAMVELQRQLAGKGVEIVFVSIDEKWAAVEQFLASNRVWVDRERLYWDPSREAAKAFGSDKFPETYVVRQDGWILEKIVGAQRWTLPASLRYFEELGAKYALEKR